MSRWYRAYEGTVTDAKLGEAALVAECSRSVAIAAWHAILESCACVNEGGRFDTTPRRIAVILCEPIKTIEALFAEFRSLRMIEGETVSAWARRQFESDNSTERSRALRERRRNGGATLQGRCATPPETETETDLREANASLVGEPADANAVDLERVKAEKRKVLAETGAWWNDLAGSLGLPQIDVIKSGSPREKHTWSRCREWLDDHDDLQSMRELLTARIRGSPLLRGEKEWVPTFDWVVTASNFQKVVEGNYEDRQAQRRK